MASNTSSNFYEVFEIQIKQLLHSKSILHITWEEMMISYHLIKSNSLNQQIQLGTNTIPPSMAIYEKLCHLWVECLLNKDILRNIWLQQINESKSIEEINRITNRNTIINILSSYRSFAGIFIVCNQKLSHEEYNELLLSTLPFDLEDSNISNDWISKFLSIYDYFPLDIQYSIISKMLCDEIFRDTVIANISSDVAIVLCDQLLRQISKKHRREESHESSSIIILANLLEVIPMEDYYEIIIDRLILRKSYDIVFSETIVYGLLRCEKRNSSGNICFNNDCSCYHITDRLLRMITSIWSLSTFIAKNDLYSVLYYTEILLCVLRRVDKSYLSSSNIMSILSDGVSKYLDLSDKRFRICGMKVAQTFARILGHELHFDELDTSLSESAATKDQNESDNNVIVSNNVVDDDDSDDEFEPYVMEESVDKIKTATYLRNCLEMLRSPETESESCNLYLRSLTSIPLIVAKNPIDGEDMCIPLMKALIVLTNTFNIENFSILHEQAIQSLSIHYPNKTIPIMISSITCDDIPLMSKLSLIESVVVIARNMASISNLDKKNLIDEDKPLSNKNQKVLNDSLSNSKTIIQRPYRLAMLKKHTHYFRNNFANYTSIFYFPLMKLLVQCLRNLDANSSNNIDKYEYLLPCHLMMALIQFTRYSYHTPSTRQLVENTLKIAILLKEHKVISLRRKAIEAILCCCEVWYYTNDNSLSQKSSIRNISPLENLIDLNSISYETNTISHEVLNESFIGVMDWLSITLKDEHDEECRILKLAILRFGVQMLEKFES